MPTIARTAADRDIAARIRAGRLARGLSLAQMAGQVGVSYQQAHKYETGASRVSAGRLHRIAEALGVEPADLFGPSAAAPDPATVAPRMVLTMTRLFAALTHEQRLAVVELLRRMTP